MPGGLNQHTCVSSKIMERIIVQQMTQYLLKCNIISDSQHGFIDKRSTCEPTNLFACFNDWTLALQDHCGVNVVYIDFAKAFDAVSHVKLIHRLKSHRIGDPLLQWIQNFLFDRSHCTRIGNVLSDFVYLISRVVQGSGLARCYLYT